MNEFVCLVPTNVLSSPGASGAFFIHAAKSLCEGRHSCVNSVPSRRAAKSVMGKNRRTQPARQRTHVRLSARVDRLEDAISHFYNVINELRRRVSTLEKKLKPLAKDD